MAGPPNRLGVLRTASGSSREPLKVGSSGLRGRMCTPLLVTTVSRSDSKSRNSYEAKPGGRRYEHQVLLPLGDAKVLRSQPRPDGRDPTGSWQAPRGQDSTP